MAWLQWKIETLEPYTPVSKCIDTFPLFLILGEHTFFLSFRRPTCVTGGCCLILTYLSYLCYSVLCCDTLLTSRRIPTFLRNVQSQSSWQKFSTFLRKVDNRPEVCSVTTRKTNIKTLTTERFVPHICRVLCFCIVGVISGFYNRLLTRHNLIIAISPA